MTIRIGKVELIGVQNLFTEEARTLVEQRVPEQQGNVFQDLGREPVGIVLEGLLYGEDALPSLENLRQAQAKAEPLAFAGDIAVGTEFSDVIIEDIRVRQLAGYRHRYRYVIKLKEYLAPPEAVDANIAGVDDAVQADADAWAADSLGAVAALQDPSSLAGTLANQPNVLEHLSMDELGSAIGVNADDLAGGDFSNILQAVSKIDLNAAMDLVQAVRDADSLGDFLSKYSDEGLDFISDLTGLDLDKASALIKALAGGLEFLKQLKEVSEKAGTLVNDVKDFDPLAGLRPVLE